MNKTFLSVALFLCIVLKASCGLTYGGLTQQDGLTSQYNGRLSSRYGSSGVLRSTPRLRSRTSRVLRTPRLRRVLRSYDDEDFYDDDDDIVIARRSPLTSRVLRRPRVLRSYNGLRSSGVLRSGRSRLRSPTFLRSGRSRLTSPTFLRSGRRRLTSPTFLRSGRRRLTSPTFLRSGRRGRVLRSPSVLQSSSKQDKIITQDGGVEQY